jgi:hypothetical protein
MHVICVCTADCRDVEGLTRVLVRLRVLGFGGMLSYKENGATWPGLRAWSGAVRRPGRLGGGGPAPRPILVQPSAVRDEPDPPRDPT